MVVDFSWSAFLFLATVTVPDEPPPLIFELECLELSLEIPLPPKIWSFWLPPPIIESEPILFEPPPINDDAPDNEPTELLGGKMIFDGAKIEPVLPPIEPPPIWLWFDLSDDIFVSFKSLLSLDLDEDDDDEDDLELLSRDDDVSFSCDLFEPDDDFETPLLCLSLSLLLPLDDDDFDETPPPTPLMPPDVTEDKDIFICGDDEEVAVTVTGLIDWFAPAAEDWTRFFDTLLDFRCFEEDDDEDEDDVDAVNETVIAATVIVLAAAAAADVAIADDGFVTEILDEFDEDVVAFVMAAFAILVALSFSGDDGESLEPVSWVIGLYGGIVLTFPPFFCGLMEKENEEKEKIRIIWDKNFATNIQTRDLSHQFTVVMLTVPTVFNVVQVVAGLLAQQTKRLGTRHMELLFAARFVALHTRSGGRTRWFTILRANVTRYKKLWRKKI